MKLFSEKETQTPEVPVQSTPKSPFKWFALAVGTFFGVAHIGVLGYLIDDKSPDFPVIQFPRGDYSSYEVEGDRDGYRIKYKANDPTVLNSNRVSESDQFKKGLFGGDTVTHRREYRSDQYTMDGVRNMGGAVTDGEGKNLAKSEECIRADAGARSQGAMAGTSIAAGLVVPAVSNIPYIGWLAGGWAMLLGQKAGSEIGSEIGSSFNDC
jgi:hypothetical protein|tara:strand:- start:86 stop:715 length:630 start_codon:yes stop_codon:yes gene_type:complete